MMSRWRWGCLCLRVWGALTATGCTASSTGESTGTLEVETVTTGPNPDLDGYRVAVDSGLARPIATQGSLTLPAVAAGERRVTLSAVAANCTVADSAARHAVLEPGQTDTVVFTVLCDSTSSRLQIRTNTSGDDLDPNGYVVIVDDLPMATVSDTGVTEVTVAARQHQVALGDVIPNCVAEDNPRVVSVASGATAPVTFEIHCAQAPLAGQGEEIAFSSDRREFPVFEFDILIQNADGTGTATVSQGAGGPAMWSQDGSLLGIALEAGIRVGSVDANGTFAPTGDVAVLSGIPVSAAWSPDGTRFAVVDFDRDSGCRGLSTVELDGAQDFLALCDLFEGNPSWSPDGKTIAISGFGESRRAIFLFDAGGGSEPRMLDTGSLQPTTSAWSPDGGRFAFAAQAVGGLDYDIFVADADGQHPLRLTRAPGDDALPTWSPDGSRIAFVSHRDGNAEIYVMDADGANQVRITNNPATDTLPAWRP